jgi:CRP-like cAMP-binding protein
MELTMGRFGSNNLLLNCLSDSDLDFIQPHLERVPLDEGDVIVGRGEVITYVCFPECGITSMADLMPDGTRVEVALIGREGMTNSQLLLGCEEADHEATVQVGGGSSLRLRASRLNELCAHSPTAKSLFFRFIHALAIQSSRTLASNAIHPASKRLSRWLLMCHDRVTGDEIHLCHDRIAKMLGVRRATVTDTLHVLEGEGALRNRRGIIIVRSRDKLEEIAADAYGFAEAQYSRLIAPFGKIERVPQDTTAQPNSRAFA